MDGKKLEEIGENIKIAHRLSRLGNVLLILGILFGLIFIVIAFSTGYDTDNTLCLIYLIIGLGMIFGNIALKYLFDTIATLMMNIIAIRKNTEK